MTETSLSRSTTMRVAVCDDVAEDLERLGTMVEELTMDRQVRVYRYESAQALLNGPAHDLVFLDILMDGLDGMDAAQALRRRSERCLIVFVSNSREHLVAGYEVQAFRYLLKPFDREDLAHILEQALSRLVGGALTVRGGDTLHRVSFADISYIEAGKHMSIVHLLDGTELVTRDGISQLERRLAGDLLVRCQKSFIVNLDEIRTLRRYEMELRSGVRIPIGRKLLPVVRQRLVRHLSMD